MTIAWQFLWVGSKVYVHLEELPWFFKCHYNWRVIVCHFAHPIDICQPAHSAWSGIYFVWSDLVWFGPHTRTQVDQGWPLCFGVWPKTTQILTECSTRVWGSLSDTAQSDNRTSRCSYHCVAGLRCSMFDADSGNVSAPMLL